MVATPKVKTPRVKPKEFLACIPVQLPKEEWENAAVLARQLNAANLPNTSLVGTGLTPSMITILTTKYFGPEERVLSVQFLDNPNAATKRMILAAMNGWGNHPRYPCGIKFAETAGQGQIRISRGRGGYYSYLGTDNLRIPAGQQTMNLEGFTERTSSSEYNRVVKHEAGHALGFPHEHARKEVIALLNREKVYAYFERTQGWSRADIDSQILTPLDVRTILGTAPDVDSIMTYQFPGSLTLSGKPIPGGFDINDTDAKFASERYPTSAPPPDGGGDVSWGANGSIEITCGNCKKKAVLTATIK
jgi:hypothetical protein